MLDSLVRVSRRVKFEILINSYFLLAIADECGPTWRRFNTNVDLEYLPPIKWKMSVFSTVGHYVVVALVWPI